MRKLRRNEIIIMLLFLKLNMLMAASFGKNLPLIRNVRAAIVNDDSSSSEEEYDPSNDKVITTIVNLNDSKSDDIFKNFNISKDDVVRKMNSQPSSLTSALTTPESNSTGDPFDEQRQYLINERRKKIEKAIDRNGSRHRHDSEATYFETAMYPVCSKNNDTTWLGSDNTARLYFTTDVFTKSPSFKLLDAVLRLRQKIVELSASERLHMQQTPTDTQNCSDPEPEAMIRVTVSILVKQQSRGDQRAKKLMCKSFMIPRFNEGWIEIDVSQVIKYWEKAYRFSTAHRSIIQDPMLAIDVEDDFMNPLKAGLFFQPNDCQASPSPAIPWSLYYGSVRNTLETEVMPSYPRLDLTYCRSHLRFYHHHPFYRNFRHRNLQRYEGYRSRKSLPSMYLDHEYQQLQKHRSDQENLNHVSDELDQTQMHKKRKPYSNHSLEFKTEEQYHQRQRRNAKSEQRIKSKRRVKIITSK